MPFDPPEPFDSMYPPESVDLPPDFPHIQHSRIPEFRTSSGQRDFSALTEQKLRKVIAKLLRLHKPGLIGKSAECSTRSNHGARWTIPS